MIRKTIAVVGATSAPGRGLVRAILDDKAGRFAARVVTLDVNTAPVIALAQLGAEVVVGHVGASVGLKSAFEGAYGAFYFRPVLNPPAMQKELAEIAAMAEAAKDAGIEHFIWATLGDAKGDIARVFKTMGVPATILHTFGNLAALRREAGGEELGRLAHGIFKSGEYIGATVPISAEVLIGAKRNPVREAASAPPAAGASSSGTALPAQRLTASAAGVQKAGQGVQRPDSIAGTGAAVATPATVRDPVSAHVAPLPQSNRRGGRPWKIILAVVVVAVSVIGAAWKVRMMDSAPATASSETEVASPPPSNVIDPMPAAPTVTSRWEQERAATRTAMRAKKEAASASPPEASPPTHRQKRRDRGHRRDGVGEGSLPSPSESSTPPELTAVQPEERPSPQGAARSAGEPSKPARPAAGMPSESPVRAASAPGFIAPQAVAAAVRVHAAEVRACFDRAVMERPDLHGRLGIRATVDPMGSVVSATPTSTIEAGGRLQACVVSAFRTWTFPRPAGGVQGEFTYSFSFE